MKVLISLVTEQSCVFQCVHEHIHMHACTRTYSNVCTCCCFHVCIRVHRCGLTCLFGSCWPCVLTYQAFCPMTEGPVSEPVSTMMQHQQTAAIIDLMTNVLSEEKLMIFFPTGLMDMLTQRNEWFKREMSVIYIWLSLKHHLRIQLQMSTQTLTRLMFTDFNYT